MMTSADMEKQTMKASKPAMEKRRRARINESLLQLKALVLDGLNKSNSRHSKLEKADILEMTVRYLRNVQRQQVKASVDTDPTVLTQYRSGFAECMGEVSRYLGGAMDENPEVRARLIGHLAGMCTTQQQQQPTRYTVGAHGQMQSPQRTNHIQPTPAVSSSSSSSTRGLVAMNSAAITTTVTSVHQPMQVSFPTPPLSNGFHVTHPATQMTSPPVEGTRAGCGSQVLGPQLQPQPQVLGPQVLGPQVLSPHAPATQILTKGISDAPPTPKSEVPSSRGKQPVMIAQSLPSTTAQQAPQPTGDMITLILPSQSLPGGQIPTHLIPVYAQEASKVVPPPLGFTFSSQDFVAMSSTPGSSNNPTVCAVSMSSPKVASTASATISPGQPTAWTTTIPEPRISPQAGSAALSAIAPPFTLTIPLNAKISPPRLAIQATQPTEPVGHPIRFSGMFPNFEASGDCDPMWRPW